MIQRIQTVWLILASAFGFISLKTSFFIGSISTEPASHLNAMSNMLLMIITIVAATVAFVSVFLFKNRPIQFKLVLSALALNLLILILYFAEMRKYTLGGLALWSVFVFAVPVLLIMAAVGIYKDDKLVKSVDRLR